MKNYFFLTLLTVFFAHFSPGQAIITRIAGDSAGAAGYSGDGGPAILSQLEQPTEVSADSVGNIYIVHGLYADAQVRRIERASGMISTIVGGGTKPTAVNGDTAVKLFFAYINGFTCGKKGKLFFSDGFVIYTVHEQTNILSIVAGQPDSTGYAGDNGPATSALFSQPEALALDEIRNYLYIADAGNNRIRRVDLNNGIITTMAGTGTAGSCCNGGLAVNATINYPNSLAVDTVGNIYFSGPTGEIRKVDYNTGIINLFAWSGVNFPQSLAINRQNTELYFADAQNHIIGAIDLTNLSEYTFAGNGTPGFTGDNGPATLAQLRYPSGVCVTNDGNVIIADSDNNVVRQISFNNEITYSSIQAIEVYPNPAQGMFTIIGLQSGDYELQLITSLGQTVYSAKGLGNEMSVNTKEYTNGVYLLQIRDTQRVICKKIIIQH